MSPSVEAAEQLRRKRIGAMPLLLNVAQRMGFDELLRHHIPPHGNEKVAAADSLLLLVFNITSGRRPLYELAQWTTEFDGRLFGWASECPRRCSTMIATVGHWTKLYAADRATMMTDLVLRVVQATQLDLTQIHNDSTSIKTCGACQARRRAVCASRAGIAKTIAPT